MRSTNKIKNSHALIQNGSSEKLRLGRSLLLQAYEYCLKRVDPYAITGAALEIDGSVMTVQGRLFDLDKYRNIFVVGAGKAGDRMAAAVENLLSGRITGGWVNIPAPVIDEESCLSRAQQPAASRIARNFAGHPLPDAAGVHGTLELLKIVEQAGVDDLVICLISGGGSSLLPLPREPLSLADKQLVTGLMLRSGADVSEINTVRKHISLIKGGWLATRCWPATVINLVLSDVIGDPLDFIASGPTVPDSTTFGDAVAVLKKYSLCEAVPAQVLQLLSAGSAGQLSETPKAHDKVFEKVFNFVIGNNLTARSAITESLHSSGVRVVGHENPFTAPVEDAVTNIYSAFSGLDSQMTCGFPWAFVAGGELTVKVSGDGTGGRNQHLALLMAARLQKLKNVVFAALSTDGIDGPTSAAGAVADTSTLARALALSLEPEVFISSHDSWRFFSSLGDLVCTGYTGSNVNDIYLAIFL